MINYFKTISDSISTQLLNMRKLAQVDNTSMKHIMYALILVDLMEWSKYKGYDENCKDLLSILFAVLINHCEFKISKTLPLENAYINVNTPQSTLLWQQLNITDNLNPIPANGNYN